MSDLRFNRLISDTATRQLVKNFTLRGMPFFNLYHQVYAYTQDAQDVKPEDGFAETFRSASRVIFQMLTSDETKNLLMESITRIKPILAKIDDDVETPANIRMFTELYTNLINEVAKDRDIYLSIKRLDSVGWSFFRIMSKKEEKLERLRKNDPEMFQNIERGRQVVHEIDKAIIDIIRSNGMKPSQTKILDRIVNIGTDTKSGDRLVFDSNGDILPVEEYIAKRKQFLRSQHKMDRVFPPDLSSIRKVSDEEIDVLGESEVTYYALTDDKAKQNQITRIYPVRKVAGQLIIVDGRFKGFYLDDVVNSAGRMIEGVAYDYDPKIARPVKLENTNEDGTLNVKVTREPYVTVNSQGQLYLKLPSGHAFSSLRNTIAELAKLVPTIEYVKDSRKSGYTFHPKDFAALRNALQGVALSTAAMELIRNYFKTLAQHELATADENLAAYSLDKIGGFRPGRDLFIKQKKALAWMESRGMSGVIALGTGVGKTVTAIASMQKMKRDGFLDDPANGNGRFLFVCPNALVGNLPKEMYGFLENPEELLDQTDVMSYQQFAKMMKKDPNFARSYVAVFFDEAQALKNPNSAMSKAVLRMQHPRKIALTASPMERSPMEVFVLTAITNNVDLTTKEGKQKLLAFRKRFCEEVGGRIVGMKSDPITARDLRVWVKQNLFFADKQDIEEIALPKLRKNTLAITMPPEIELAYRQITENIQSVLTGMTAKYRDRDTSATDPAIETARIKLRKEFQALTELSLMPDLLIPGSPNPKLEECVRLIDQRVESNARVILFTDVPRMAMHTVQRLSNDYPGRLHAVGLADAIEIWKDGRRVSSYGKKAYVGPDGSKYAPGSWKVYVLKYIVANNPEILTLTLTSTYAVGQNLQEFSTVIHLDRDSWNSETMTQRTARAWRTGQDRPVDEITLDAVYANPRATRDATLDQIRAAMQQMEADLFDQVVIQSQVEALGKEFFEMRRQDASFYALNRKMMEMQLSPYVARIGQED